MNWRYVLDTSNMAAGTDINDAVKLAQKTGYKFISWNGEVLFVDDMGKAHNTGILVASMGAG